MKLFQYWDTHEPPDEVAAWIEGFRSGNPLLKHRLYHRDSASWLIRKRFGEREQRAFDACAVPSMQSDFFRYCAIEALGGVYADADYQLRQPLKSLLRPVPDSLALMWRGHWVGGLLMAREPGNAFIRACRELATDNIEGRRFESAYTATGPGVMNAIRLLLDPASEEEILKGFDNKNGRTWHFPELLERARTVIELTPELKAAHDAFTIIHHLRAERWIGTQPPQYKTTARHWLHWQGPAYDA